MHVDKQLTSFATWWGGGKEWGRKCVAQRQRGRERRKKRERIDQKLIT
jgi:hypothetical protein